MGNRLRSPDQGADTVVWLCVANQAKDQPSGSFFQGIIVIWGPLHSGICICPLLKFDSMHLPPLERNPEINPYIMSCVQ